MGWPKIKGVFTEIIPICEALKQAAQECEQNVISISFVATDGDATNKSLNQLSPTFMYTQILKEILLSIEFDEGHIKEFIDHCHAVFAENEGELKNVDKLQGKYHDKTPIWWYTYECFLYSMLNRALRLIDVDILIKMGFFISDLHRHIERLHTEQFRGINCNQTFTIYRGQGLSKTDFNQMMEVKGGLMSFNNFLSTSKDRNVSLNFARRALPNSDMVGILFVMTIDPAKSTAPFASIVDVSYYQDAENEVLFSMHTVFRIVEIKPMGENHRLFQVELTLSSDDDKDLRMLTDHIRKETKGSAGWYRLSLLLLKMGKPNEAEKLYEVLLGQVTNDGETAYINQLIGATKNGQGEYTKALSFYEKSLEFYKKILPKNHPDLACPYDNIGVMYEKMGEYRKALSSYEKSLEIRRQSLPLNHPDLAASYNNIGIVYKEMAEYPKALSSHVKALEIRQQSLPPNHPDLGSSYNNIGIAYNSMGEYSEALSSFQKALEIKQSTLPWNHPSLAVSCGYIGDVYSNMGEYSKALLFCQRAVDIGQQSLPSNHPHLQWYRNNLETAKKKL